MNVSMSKAVAAGITKAQNTWGIVNRSISRNNVINPRIEIMIWNSLIRSTMSYGMRAKELPRSLLNQLETYMYKHIRTMMNPRWKDEAWRPENKQLYKETKQPAMESWLNKRQITTMLMQTQDTETIQPKQRKKMMITKQKLQAKLRIRNNGISENSPQRRAGNEEEGEYIKTSEKTEITHLVETHPEMPGELEMNREDRKKLGELMLEYPTKTDEHEEEAERGKEQRRY